MEIRVVSLLQLDYEPDFSERRIFRSGVKNRSSMMERRVGGMGSWEFEFRSCRSSHGAQHEREVGRGSTTANRQGTHRG